MNVCSLVAQGRRSGGGEGGTGWLFYQGGPWMCGQGHGQSGSLEVGPKMLS